MAEQQNNVSMSIYLYLVHFLFDALFCNFLKLITIEDKDDLNLCREEGTKT